MQNRESFGEHVFEGFFFLRDVGKRKRSLLVPLLFVIGWIFVVNLYRVYELTLIYR